MIFVWSFSYLFIFFFFKNLYTFRKGLPIYTGKYLWCWKSIHFYRWSRLCKHLKSFFYLVFDKKGRGTTSILIQCFFCCCLKNYFQVILGYILSITDFQLTCSNILTMFRGFEYIWEKLCYMVFWRKFWYEGSFVI